MSEKLVSIIAGVFTIACVIVYHCMVIYGSTKVEIPTECIFGCSLGDRFAELPLEVDGFEVYEGHGSRTYIPDYRHRVNGMNSVGMWEYTFEASGDLIDCFHMQSMPIEDKKKAKEMMSALSESMSDNFTSGRGLRAYKRSRNYVYNKKQGVMMEIRLEYTNDSYTVNVYYMRYSWIKRVWRAIYWNCFSFKRPGINVGRIFIPN